MFVSFVICIFGVVLRFATGFPALSPNYIPFPYTKYPLIPYAKWKLRIDYFRTAIINHSCAKAPQRAFLSHRADPDDFFSAEIVFRELINNVNVIIVNRPYFSSRPGVGPASLCASLNSY